MKEFEVTVATLPVGHMVDAPAILIHASVVSRETVRTALTWAALNDLEVKASDMENAESFGMSNWPMEFGPEA
jgi:hypothetical protein